MNKIWDKQEDENFQKVAKFYNWFIIKTHKKASKKYLNNDLAIYL